MWWVHLFWSRNAKSPGHGVTLGLFSDFFQIAKEFQNLIRERNANVEEDAVMHFRIGLNMGDVIVEGENLYGEGVNVAARLEALSQPDGVSLSKSILDFVNKKTEM